MKLLRPKMIIACSSLVGTILSIAGAPAAAPRAACSVRHGVAAGKAQVAVADLGIVVGDNQRRFVQFRAPVFHVTTDGAPNSFSSTDLTVAGGLNTICNAVPAYALDANGNRLNPLSCKETIAAFKTFRDAGWVVPPRVELNWRAGLKSVDVNGHTQPCVFSSGPYKGFIASETRLKNGIAGDKGECDIADQVDPRAVYGVTIQWGQNFIRQSGVQLGDLAVVSLRQKNGSAITIAAVVVDSGGVRQPAMGTVALNAKLLGASGPFDKHAAVNQLDIKDDRGVEITIVPGSAGYELARPFTNENIKARMDKFAGDAGFSSVAEMIGHVRACIGSK
jgi:hypothetical protein